jgi:hypothetical protein
MDTTRTDTVAAMMAATKALADLEKAMLKHSSDLTSDEKDVMRSLIAAHASGVIDQAAMS